MSHASLMMNSNESCPSHDEQGRATAPARRAICSLEKTRRSCRCCFRYGRYGRYIGYDRYDLQPREDPEILQVLLPLRPLRRLRSLRSAAQRGPGEPAGADPVTHGICSTPTLACAALTSSYPHLLLNPDTYSTPTSSVSLRAGRTSECRGGLDRAGDV